MNTERKNKAQVFDLDDTIFARERIIRVLGFINGKLHPQSHSLLMRADIMRFEINHGRVDSQIEGWKERLAFEAHARRQIFPWVLRILEALAEEGVDIYGNTGRPSKTEWVDMTYESLDKEGIGKFFTDVAFTPEGVKTAVSKAHRLDQLARFYGNKRVEYFEDDPRTIIFLAPLFPEIRINYVQHKLSGLLVPDHELMEFGNVQKVILHK